MKEIATNIWRKIPTKKYGEVELPRFRDVVIIALLTTIAVSTHYPPNISIFVGSQVVIHWFAIWYGLSYGNWKRETENM